MPSYPVILLKPFVYAGQKYQAGAQLDLKAVSDLRVLKALGVARDVPATAPPKPPPQKPVVPVEPVPEPVADVATEDDEAVEDEAETADATPEKKRRRYRRADMQADGE
jgi:hypothetical protein